MILNMEESNILMHLSRYPGICKTPDIVTRAFGKGSRRRGGCISRSDGQ